MATHDTPQIFQKVLFTSIYFEFGSGGLYKLKYLFPLHSMTDSLVL